MWWQARDTDSFMRRGAGRDSEEALHAWVGTVAWEGRACAWVLHLAHRTLCPHDKVSRHLCWCVHHHHILHVVCIRLARIRTCPRKHPSNGLASIPFSRSSSRRRTLIVYRPPPGATFTLVPVLFASTSELCLAGVAKSSSGIVPCGPQWRRHRDRRSGRFVLSMSRPVHLLGYATILFSLLFLESKSRGPIGDVCQCILLLLTSSTARHGEIPGLCPCLSATFVC